jgi:hypothetical protein
MSRPTGRNFGSPALSNPSSTLTAASSGSTSRIGRSSASLPRSTSCMAAVDVIALVMEAIQNNVSTVMAAPDGSARLPNAPW